MMSRRRFLQITVSMVAVGTMPALVPGDSIVRVPPPDEIWIPTVLEVAEWLEYYKLTVTHANQRFTDIMLNLATENDDPAELERIFSSAEADFNLMQGERQRVAGEQYSGYEAGRGGRPRANPRFLKPSHPGFGWYNYWAVGDYDRRRKLRLPRHGRTLEEEYLILRRETLPS